MNLILLTGNDNSDSPDARLPRLKNLLAWLVAHQEPMWIHAYAPPQDLTKQSEVIRFLIESARDFGCGTSLIIGPEAVRNNLLDHPYLRCLDELILTFDPERDEMSSIVGPIETYSASLKESEQAVRIWAYEAIKGGAHAAMTPWLKSISSRVEVLVAPFSLGQRSVPASKELAEHLHALPKCRLYENSITIGPDARILACPQHLGGDQLIDLGDLSEQAPESILLKHQINSNLVRSCTLCGGCRLDARFSWPDSRGETVIQLLQTAVANAAQGKTETSDEVILDDISNLSADGIDRVMARFRERLRSWSATCREPATTASDQLFVSIETPVIKGRWLIQCVESVLNQSSPYWYFSLLWDHGDELSHRILRELESLQHPRISIYYSEGLGIARARKFLTDRTAGQYILPLDDDDLLLPNTVERFVEAAAAMPWAGIIRGRRSFVDESGTAVQMNDWFPFEPRQYFRGMTCDLYNHCQPSLISRARYGLTTGWEGFREYKYAGEDCDIFLKIEEVAEVELFDEVLYQYRINPERTSLDLGNEAAMDMWQRLAEKTIGRRKLALQRNTDQQPYSYKLLERQPADWSDIEVVNDISDLELVLKRSRRRIICLLRDGVELPTPAVLDQMVERFCSSDADIAGPKLVDADGRLISSDPYFNANMLPKVQGEQERDHGQYDHCSPAAWLPSSLLLIRAEVLRSVGTFDPSFTSAALQSADFCLRARSRGFRCVYLGTIKAVQKDRFPEVLETAELERFTQRWGRSVHLLYLTEEIAAV